MMTKAQINALFGTKSKGLEWMTDEVGKAFDKKEEIYIDFGKGAEEIDSVMRDGHNKKVTFFYMFGNDRRSITLWESDNPTFSFNATFGCYQMNPIRQKREVKDKKTTTTLDLDGFFEDVIYLTLDIILELNKNRNATHYVSDVQMKYLDSARVPIINGAIFRFEDKHGDSKVFVSTPETKLRVLKLGDETQLHLEHARKIKLD